MLSRLLRQLLFTLLHFLINLLVAVQNIYCGFSMQNCMVDTYVVNKNDIEAILQHVPRMEKKPKHLVVLVKDDNLLRDLARVVIWSLIAGVPYVSFYDATGILKDQEEKLFFEVEKNKKGIPGCVKWSNMPDLNGYTNGNQAHVVNINIFSFEDGKPKIAQCIKQIAEGKLECSRETVEFTAQEFDKVLAFIYPSIPDPDLVLYSGPVCCTHGLLPWQIRLTEFIQLSVGNNIHINNYLDALYKYNKCDQRFGK